MKMLRQFLCIATLTFSASTFADSSLSEHLYDLYDGTNNYTYTLTGENGVLVDGTTIKVGVTAWSDTLNYYGDYISGHDTRVVDQNNLDRYWSSVNNDYGFGIKNNNRRDSHTVDNFGGNDFDMILFSFTEAVTMSMAQYTWTDGNNYSKEVSVVGLSDISQFKNAASSQIRWQDINSVVTSGHFSISGNNSGAAEGAFTSSFTGLSAAKYWLVGAYNTYFDDNATTNFGTGFKLANVSFQVKSTSPGDDSKEVNEPGTLALMLLGGGLVAMRRRRRAQSV